MKILIDAASDGYAVIFEPDDGERKTYSGDIHSLQDAMSKAYALAAAVEIETGARIEPLISAAAIRENRHRDIAARKLWDDPNYRVVR